MIFLIGIICMVLSICNMDRLAKKGKYDLAYYTGFLTITFSATVMVAGLNILGVVK